MGEQNVHDEEWSGRQSVVLPKKKKKKSVKDGASQFQKFIVNFLKFHTLFFTRLSQLR
jgi:hypothetical protein